MSDATLRTLERRWQESGVIEDEARYLREAVRSGQLPSENLAAAALMNAPPALEALGGNPTGSRNARKWLDEVVGIAGIPTALRCAHAAAWVGMLTVMAHRLNPWLPGAIGRTFQLSAFRALGGHEPRPGEAITGLEQEAVETANASWKLGGPSGPLVLALTHLRTASALIGSGVCDTGVSGPVAYCVVPLLWAADVLDADGVMHACSFLVAPWLLYGEDPLDWWRSGIRTIVPRHNLYVARSPWYMDALPAAT